MYNAYEGESCLSEERWVGAGLRTGLEVGWKDPVTERTVLVVILDPLVVTHRLVVQRTHAAADNFPAVFYFLCLFLRLLRVLVQAEISLTLQSGPTESEDLRCTLGSSISPRRIYYQVKQSVRNVPNLTREMSR